MHIEIILRRYESFRIILIRLESKMQDTIHFLIGLFAVLYEATSLENEPYFAYNNVYMYKKRGR